jgi:hypothetical protein
VVGAVLYCCPHSQDSFGSRIDPVAHPREFAASTHQSFALGFDLAAADRQGESPIGRIIDSASVVFQVPGEFIECLAFGRRSEPRSLHLQRRERLANLAGPQRVLKTLGPSFGCVAAFAEQKTGCLVHVLAQVIPTQAIHLWAATGLNAAQISTLQHVKFVIADLAGGMLGEETGTTIYIDTNAAGYGWSLGQRVGRHKVDLLTVVAHELGHELGLADVDSSNVMDGTLPSGVRRLPGVGANS